MSLCVPTPAVIRTDDHYIPSEMEVKGLSYGIIIATHTTFCVVYVISFNSAHNSKVKWLKIINSFKTWKLKVVVFPLWCSHLEAELFWIHTMFLRIMCLRVQLLKSTCPTYYRKDFPPCCVRVTLPCYDSWSWNNALVLFCIISTLPGIRTPRNFNKNGDSFSSQDFLAKCSSRWGATNLG